MGDDLTLTVNSEAALNDAKEVKKIVNSMQESMQTLDDVIENCIADGVGDTGILTNWSTTVKSNWKSYVAKDIPAAFSDMRETANNLQIAVDRAEAYSNERM